LGVAGQADLYVNGEKVIDNTTDQKAGLLFVSVRDPGEQILTRSSRLELKSEQRYIRSKLDASMLWKSGFPTSSL